MAEIFLENLQKIRHCTHRETANPSSVQQLKDLNPAIVGVCYEKSTFVIDKQTCGEVELPRSFACPAPEHKQVTRHIKGLNVVKCRV